MMNKAAIFLGLISCFLGSSSVAGILTTNVEAVNGVLTVCPGDFVSIMCSHGNDQSGVTRWEVIDNPTAACTHTVSHGSPVNGTCGPFTITMISGSTDPPFNSTAQTTATEALDGARVQCFSSGLPDSLIGNITINVLAITPNITSVEPVSQSVIRVSLSVTDSQCVDRYQVETTPVGGSGPTNTSSPTSTVEVSGLDVCQYNYIFVGSTFTASGFQSELSSPENFSVISVLRGITVTINSVDPLIDWVQMDNSFYSTCITEYFIDGGAGLGLNTTVNSTTRSLTAQQLNAAGFPYCIRIQPTVTPITAVGSLMAAGNMFTDLIDPDFPTPMLTSSLTLSNGTNETVTLRITIQNVSEAMVPIRNYQYTINSGTPSAVMNISGDYFEIVLSQVDTALTVSVTVTFQRMEVCREMTTASYTVSRSITDLTEGTPTDTSHTIAITLPLTEYQPEQLLIISTASAPGENNMTEMANFTSPSMQYMVTFTDLDPATMYTFTIRIVLRSNNTVDVVPAVTGRFTTAPMDTPSPSPTNPPRTPTGGCDGGCVAGIVVAIVVILIIVVVIVIVVVVFVFVIPKRQEANSKGPKQPGQQELNTYEKPETVKVEIVADEEETLPSSEGFMQ